MDLILLGSYIHLLCIHIKWNFHPPLYHIPSPPTGWRNWPINDAHVTHLNWWQIVYYMSIVIKIDFMFWNLGLPNYDLVKIIYLVLSCFKHKYDCLLEITFKIGQIKSLWKSVQLHTNKQKLVAHYFLHITKTPRLEKCKWRVKKRHFSCYLGPG